MTLGILDECRSLGLGTMLLEETYRYLAYHYPECQMAYLHVVDYNTAAIKFYRERNGYQLFKVEKNHYMIFDKEYDALTLYRLIDRKRFVARS